MAKPKGPEKKLIALRVTLPTFEWLQRKAGNKKVPTYLAETVEQQAANALKTRTREVSPNFKKGGKK
jgi:hypothetical protein